MEAMSLLESSPFPSGSPIPKAQGLSSLWDNSQGEKCWLPILWTSVSLFHLNNYDVKGEVVPDVSAHAEGENSTMGMGWVAPGDQLMARYIGVPSAQLHSV